MRIENKIERYLVNEESSKIKAYNKIVKSIRSMKTPDQADIILKMIEQYHKKYGNLFTSMIDYFTAFVNGDWGQEGNRGYNTKISRTNKLIDKINNKLDQIELEVKNKKR